MKCTKCGHGKMKIIICSLLPTEIITPNIKTNQVKMAPFFLNEKKCPADKNTCSKNRIGFGRAKSTKNTWPDSEVRNVNCQ
jgi:hypothetical protein